MNIMYTIEATPANNQPCNTSSGTYSIRKTNECSRTVKDRPKKVTFAEDYYKPNENAENNLYSTNESQMNPNLSAEDARFCTVEPRNPDNNYVLSRFATLVRRKQQRSEQDPFYDEASLSPTSPPSYRTEQNLHGNRKRAEESSRYYDCHQSNSTRGAGMASGYNNRNQANRRYNNLQPGNRFTHVSQSDTTPFTFSNESHYLSNAADMNSRYSNHPNSYTTASSCTESPFTQLIRHDSTPFLFLDDMHDISEAIHMTPRYANRSPGYASSGNPNTRLGPNDASHLLLDAVHDESSIRCPCAISYAGEPSNLSQDDIRPFSPLNDNYPAADTVDMISYHYKYTPSRSHSSFGSYCTTGTNEDEIDVYDLSQHMTEPEYFCQAQPCYETRNDFYSSIEADKGSGYFDRCQTSSSRRDDMRPEYFDRNQANSCSNMNSGSPDSSYMERPCTNISTNDTNHFYVLDDSELSSCEGPDMVSGYF